MGTMDTKFPFLTSLIVFNQTHETVLSKVCTPVNSVDRPVNFMDIACANRID
jgi:hypothetical protein